MLTNTSHHASRACAADAWLRRCSRQASLCDPGFMLSAIDAGSRAGCPHGHGARQGSSTDGAFEHLLLNLGRPGRLGVVVLQGALRKDAQQLGRQLQGDRPLPAHQHPKLHSNLHHTLWWRVDHGPSCRWGSVSQAQHAVYTCSTSTCCLPLLGTGHHGSRRLPVALPVAQGPLLVKVQLAWHQALIVALLVSHSPAGLPRLQTHSSHCQAHYALQGRCTRLWSRCCRVSAGRCGVCSATSQSVTESSGVSWIQQQACRTEATPGP